MIQGRAANSRTFGNLRCSQFAPFSGKTETLSELLQKPLMIWKKDWFVARHVIDTVHKFQLGVLSIDQNEYLSIEDVM